MSRNQNIKPTPADQKEREAQEAQALKDNPMLQRMLDEIEGAYTHEWKMTEGPHTEYRERAYFMVRSVEKLRQHINEYVTNGKMGSRRAKDTLEGK